MEKVKKPSTWTREAVIEQLKADNPRATLQNIQIYADLFMQYHEATSNIREVGTVCAHPRTAQPIENPYCRIQASALKALQGFKVRLKTDALWKEK